MCQETSINKILLVGAWHSTNLGDPLLCRCTEWLLQELAPEAEIIRVDVEANPEIPADYDPPIPQASKLLRIHREHMAVHLITANTPWDLRGKLCAKRFEARREDVLAQIDSDADLLVVAGGQMLINWFGLYLAAIVERCQELSIPVVFNACGTGPDDSSYVMSRLKRALALSVVQQISLRDGLPKVSGWGFTDAIDTCDPGLFAAEAFPESTGNAPEAESTDVAADVDATADQESQAIMENHSRPIGIGVISSSETSIRKELRILENLCGYLEAKRVPYVLFNNGSPKDEGVIRMLQERLRKKGIEARSLERPRTPEELMQQERGLRGVISYRLHSQIVACSLGLPSVGITWDEKMRVFYAKIGCPERCLEGDVKPEVILETFLNAEKAGYDNSRLRAMKEEMRNRLTLVLRRA